MRYCDQDFVLCSNGLLTPRAPFLRALSDTAQLRPPHRAGVAALHGMDLGVFDGRKGTPRSKNARLDISFQTLVLPF